jgi:hypothetical protein
VEKPLLSCFFLCGLQAGTKVTFENEGDQGPGRLPADIVFVLAAKHHPVFTREGDDLIMTYRVPLRCVRCELLGWGRGAVCLYPLPAYRVLMHAEHRPRFPRGCCS